MLTFFIMALGGCEIIDEQLKVAVCDRDGDTLPRASEYCGGNDCNDDDANIGEPASWYRDVDNDTFGTSESVLDCAKPDGFVEQNGDCDDTEELVNPEATETCNGYDDDCDGGVDDENVPVWYADVDEDTYGNPESTLTQCDQPSGYVGNDLDCDDTTDLVSPDDAEICDDGIDQDCNELIDDAEGSQMWYADVDIDGYGDPATLRYSCEASLVGYVLDNQDCNDAVYDISPAAFEACGDGIDNDCDGEIDTDAVDVPWYADSDGDGYGDAATTQTDCAPPDGYVGNSEDCDDGNAQMNPGVEEICNNGMDDNCDDSPTPCKRDGMVSLADASTTFISETTGDGAGWSVASDCDINDDGQDDLLVGAYHEDSGGLQSGAVYLFYGPVSAGDTSLADADVKFTGEAQDDLAGYTVTCSGDVNNDGYDDVLIGANEESTAAIDAGAAYLFYGPVSAGDTSLADANVKFTGEAANDRAGTSLSSGDINNDGYDDILIGADQESSVAANAGAAYLFYGPVSAGDISLADANVKFTGEATGDRAGNSLHGQGDINNDGYDDILIGAYTASPAGSASGAAYLFYGPVSDGEVGLAAADVKFTGEDEGDYAGVSVKSLQDINNDGYDEVAIGAYQESSVALNAGAAYLFYGPVSAGDISLADADVKFTGEAADDSAGYRLASACDINNDGYSDLTIGATPESSVALNAGAAYLFYGPVSAGDISLADADVKFTGEAEGDRAGIALTCSNGTDGYDGLLIGAFERDSSSGAAYLIYGLGL
jgi:hypothetical protein